MCAITFDMLKSYLHSYDVSRHKNKARQTGDSRDRESLGEGYRLPVSRGISARMTSAITHAAAPLISAGRP
jgi:hypothetical protein